MLCQEEIASGGSRQDDRGSADTLLTASCLFLHTEQWERGFHPAVPWSAALRLHQTPERLRQTPLCVKEREHTHEGEGREAELMNHINIIGFWSPCHKCVCFC